MPKRGGLLDSRAAGRLRGRIPATLQRLRGAASLRVPARKGVSITEQEPAKGLYYKESCSGRSFQSRWDEIRPLADFRPTDHVLDVGCAEGLITLEVATLVERAHGIDVHPGRVAEANRLAVERGLSNATFELASVLDYPFEPLSYDVTLFMAVWGKPADDRGTTRAVGADDLRRILGATRRQLVMRAGVQQQARLESRLEEILDVCGECDFDALCFSRPARKRETGEAGGNMLIANRRGTDARAGELPRLALVPTSLLRDHPVVAGAKR
jgi:SAM-dependent methyltransferase